MVKPSEVADTILDTSFQSQTSEALADNLFDGSDQNTSKVVAVPIDEQGESSKVSLEESASLPQEGTSSALDVVSSHLDDGEAAMTENEIKVLATLSDSSPQRLDEQKVDENRDETKLSDAMEMSKDLVSSAVEPSSGSAVEPSLAPVEEPSSEPAVETSLEAVQEPSSESAIETSLQPAMESSQNEVKDSTAGSTDESATVDAEKKSSRKSKKVSKSKKLKESSSESAVEIPSETAEEPSSEPSEEPSLEPAVDSSLLDEAKDTPAGNTDESAAVDEEKKSSRKSKKESKSKKRSKKETSEDETASDAIHDEPASDIPQIIVTESAETPDESDEVTCDTAVTQATSAPEDLDPAEETLSRTDSAEHIASAEAGKSSENEPVAVESTEQVTPPVVETSQQADESADQTATEESSAQAEDVELAAPTSHEDVQPAAATDSKKEVASSEEEEDEEEEDDKKKLEDKKVDEGGSTVIESFEVPPTISGAVAEETKTTATPEIVITTSPGALFI